MALDKTEKRLKIKRRVRKNIQGTPERPRLSVYRSNKEIYAQIIDDINGVTLASASSRENDIAETKGTKSEISTIVGKKVAEKAKAAGIENVIFDRNGFIYHGRIEALAKGAREGGLKF
ncbi:50S ribosomal protein L18 [Weeksellaceae bacterium KMM 9713]|uniref:Large ribosomal subunit protein uL18 n=1 Tax=Profundicola chukchiensis TaxID=2961959 RepID=A0A9X4MWP1_9FLAO|nr:50S ribosomal protein L18 [Profundicola chukchiensis]MDG4946268.1 50S ribosomal protein L18 [Profundicola chukchiensis]MDG4950808.1 50S ribosomal protein L18 [Profundicola chukchiensis]